MDALQVEIVTPERAVYSGKVAEVLLPAWEGQLGVLPDHDTLLSLLKCGVCEVRDGSGVKRWVIGRGFADMGGDHVTVLTDRAVAVESLDKDAARTELAAAMTEIEGGTLSNEAAKQAAVRAEWAQAVLDA